MGVWACVDTRAASDHCRGVVEYGRDGGLVLLGALDEPYAARRGVRIRDLVLSVRGESTYSFGI